MAIAGFVVSVFDRNRHVAEESALLMVLIESAQPLRRGEFAEIMLRDKTTITRQLDGLEEKGLVRRSRIRPMAARA